MANDDKLVIAVGDWYIDENWFVLPQKLFHSSHTGDAHYLATFHRTGNELVSFCGVAGLLYFLHEYQQKQPESGGRYKLHGFGVWNHADNAILRCIMCPGYGANKLLTPHTLSGLRSPKDAEAGDGLEDNPAGTRHCPYGTVPLKVLKIDGPERNFVHNWTVRQAGLKIDGPECKFARKIRFRNLLDRNCPGASSYSTNRIIRCFEGFPGQEPHLKYRFDWTSDVKEGDLVIGKATNPDANNASRTEGGLPGLASEEKAAAIIIEDHGLGVVNDQTIVAVNSHIGPETKVFVRTKNPNPSWLKKLERPGKPGEPGKVDLIVADHNLARHFKGHRRWVYGDELGGAALKLIDNLKANEYVKGQPLKRKGFPNIGAVAVLLDDNSVIAGFDDGCFFVKKPLEGRQILNTGRTTTFYAALIGQILNSQILTSQILNSDSAAATFRGFCLQARDCAYEWSKQVSQPWEESEAKSRIHKQYEETIATLRPPGGNGGRAVPVHTQVRKTWEASAENLGLVKVGDREVLQLWRATGTLPDYIVVWGEKRDAINGLITRLAEFKADQSPKQSLSCLLTASPGWGKSFLARKLADRFDMMFLEFSVAQIPTTTAFVDCLATIASVQNRSKDKVLVFFDEVNAEIEGHSVYGLFLGPLSDGGFVFEGKSYRLNPAAWLFASSRSVLEDGGDERTVVKGSDFVSRLNGPIINLDYDTGNREYARVTAAFKRQLYAVADHVSEQDRNQGMTKLRELYHVSTDRRWYDALWKRKKETLLVDAVREGRSAPLLVEQVYLIVNAIRRCCGPIREIQYIVLELFRDVIAVNGIRSIEFFATCFEGIRNGKVTWKNVPDLMKYVSLRRHVLLPERWLTREDRQELVDEIMAQGENGAGPEGYDPAKKELLSVAIETAPRTGIL